MTHTTTGRQYKANLRFDRQTSDQVREAADDAGVSMAHWIREAVTMRLAGRAAVAGEVMTFIESAKADIDRFLAEEIQKALQAAVSGVGDLRMLDLERRVRALERSLHED